MHEKDTTHSSIVGTTVVMSDDLTRAFVTKNPETLLQLAGLNHTQFARASAILKQDNNIKTFVTTFPNTLSHLATMSDKKFVQTSAKVDTILNKPSVSSVIKSRLLYPVKLIKYLKAKREAIKEGESYIGFTSDKDVKYGFSCHGEVSDPDFHKKLPRELEDIKSARSMVKERIRISRMELLDPTAESRRVALIRLAMDIDPVAYTDKKSSHSGGESAGAGTGTYGTDKGVAGTSSGISEKGDEARKLASSSPVPGVADIGTTTVAGFNVPAPGARSVGSRGKLKTM